MFCQPCGRFRIQNFFDMTDERDFVQDTSFGICTHNHEVAQLHKTITAFFDIASPAQYQKNQNELLHVFVNKAFDEKEVSKQDLIQVIELTTFTTQFIVTLKENWDNVLLALTPKTKTDEN